MSSSWFFLGQESPRLGFSGRMGWKRAVDLIWLFIFSMQKYSIDYDHAPVLLGRIKSFRAQKSIACDFEGSVFHQPNN